MEKTKDLELAEVKKKLQQAERKADELGMAKVVATQELEHEKAEAEKRTEGEEACEEYDGEDKYEGGEKRRNKRERTITKTNNTNKRS